MTNQTIPCREAFEKWARPQGLRLHVRDMPGCSRPCQYGSDETQLAFEAFRAAWTHTDDRSDVLAWCEPDNPFNCTAFAWPGSERDPARHTQPLFARPQHDTRAQSSAPEGGEAVAYAQFEDGKCVALAFTPIADADCQIPLYPCSNAQGGVPFDRIEQIIKMMQAYRYEADEYKGRYITSSWETMLGALMTEFGAPGYTALSTSRSNDKGTEGG